MRFALVEMRSDLDQYFTGMGHPRNNQAWPCFLCRCPVAKLHDPMDKDEFPLLSHEAYMALIAQSTVKVSVDHADLRSVFHLLKMDDRKDGVHGMALVADVEVTDQVSGKLVTLRRWDRLESSAVVDDVHITVEELARRNSGVPVMLQFWRKSPNHSFAFSSQLWQIPGFRFEMQMIDDLHTVYLGVVSQLAGGIFVQVLKSGQPFGNTKDEAGMQKGVVRLSHALRRSYKKADPSTSRMSKLSLKTLSYTGSKSRGALKSKGHEAKCIIPFVYGLVCKEEVQAALGRAGKPLKMACKALVMAVKLMDGGSRRIDADELERLFEKCNKYCKRGGIHVTPKFHFSRHLGDVARRAGNPAMHSAFSDESQNRLLVKMAQACQVGEFAARLLSREQLQKTKLSRQLFS